MKTSISPMLSEKIAQSALRSMLYEVAATPKPGLVDRANAGAHQDMDYFSFMASSSVLVFFFQECAQLGAKYAAEESLDLFPALREAGLRAEKEMFAATGGVNTHKGLVFSLGIISAAAACCMTSEDRTTKLLDRICAKSGAITRGICERDFASVHLKERRTNGETLHLLHGFKGIRGEVEQGFPTVVEYAFPALNACRAQRILDFNDSLVQVLMVLLSVTEDTNIAARCGKDAICEVRRFAREALDCGGMYTSEGRRMIHEMDRIFIERNVSPGGSADLLAVTIMFDLLEQMAPKYMGVEAARIGAQTACSWSRLQLQTSKDTFSVSAEALSN
ncbi:MAG TPA: triphosphoribosyl-dephospho-CoA synthase CitG [Dissulfurispiraceae bacterium]|nr:triphosphoribosyl-dephospho-CoA synthase CitG [Dissulfurispiraceae bacterium]